MFFLVLQWSCWRRKSWLFCSNNVLARLAALCVLCLFLAVPCIRLWSVAVALCGHTHFLFLIYIKTCVKRPLSKRPKMFFKTDYRLMQVKSIAECSILQYVWPSFSYHLSLRSFWVAFYTCYTVVLIALVTLYNFHLSLYYVSSDGFDWVDRKWEKPFL